MKFKIVFTSNLILVLFLFSCTPSLKKSTAIVNPEFVYQPTQKKLTDIVISRADYRDHLSGFWLGQCIANWTGLVTEMDKIGNIGDIKTGNFYTREDWGKPDLPSIWGEGIPSDLSPTIDFVIRGKDEIWGADDDTDIEYMYQYLLATEKTSVLSGEQIKNGWLKHIKKEEENFLWVANQKALDMMMDGQVPPDTSDPKFTSDSIYSNYYEMIDAQLTTEIFGLFAPGRPDMALKMARLPIQTTARENAQWISEFYVVMHSLAPVVNKKLTNKDQVFWLADEARKQLPDSSYSAKMFDFVRSKYDEGLTWEAARDAVYERYQVEEKDGYRMTSKNMYCNGCFVGGINFASSLVSLFFGKGDFKETIKIGVLAGWDSDNPSATWGGLLGFMYGKKGIENTFGSTFSNRFNIHRTRQNFPNEGLDDFDNMSKTGVFIIDRVIQDELGGGVDLESDSWFIPEVD